MDVGQRTRGHTNGGKGMGIMPAKRQGGISCRGYRGLGENGQGARKRGAMETGRKGMQAEGRRGQARGDSGDRGVGDTGDRGQGIGRTGGNG